MMTTHLHKLLASRSSFMTRIGGLFLVAAMLSACQPDADRSGKRLAYLAQSDGYWQVWVAEQNGANAQQLTTTPSDVSRISWFPDGKTLLVNFQDGRMFRVNVANGESTPIQAPMQGIQDAVISPDGKTIAFSYGASESTYNNDVWMFDMASGAPLKLTAIPGLQHDPAWSSDGKWLYFLSGRGGQTHDIWRLQTANRSMEQITVNELYHFDLALRPDGVIAYSGNRSGNYDLWLRYPDGRTEALTNDIDLDARPTWAADGQSLLFESTREDGMNVWRFNLKTKAITPVTKTKDGARMPVIAVLGGGR
jgi:TolB protein